MSKGNELLDSIFNDDAPKTTATKAKATTKSKAEPKQETKEDDSLAPWEQPAASTMSGRIKTNKPEIPPIEQTEFAPVSFANYQLSKFKEKITFDDSKGAAQVVKVRGLDDPNIVIHMKISEGMFAVENKQTKTIKPLSFEGMFKHLYPGLDTSADMVSYNANLRKLYEEKYVSNNDDNESDDELLDDTLTQLLSPGEVVKSAVKVAEDVKAEAKEPVKRTRKTKAEMESIKQEKSTSITTEIKPVEESFDDLTDDVSANVLTGAEPQLPFRNNTTTATANTGNVEPDFGEVAQRFTTALIDLLKAINRNKGN